VEGGWSCPIKAKSAGQLWLSHEYDKSLVFSKRGCASNSSTTARHLTLIVVPHARGGSPTHQLKARASERALPPRNGPTARDAHRAAAMEGVDDTTRRCVVASSVIMASAHCLIGGRGLLLLNVLRRDHFATSSSANQCFLLCGVLLLHGFLCVLALDPTAFVCRWRTSLLVFGSTMVDAALCFSAVKAWRGGRFVWRTGWQLRYDTRHVVIVHAFCLTIAAAFLVGPLWDAIDEDGGGACVPIRTSVGVPALSLQCTLLLLGLYSSRRAAHSASVTHAEGDRTQPPFELRALQQQISPPLRLESWLAGLHWSLLFALAGTLLFPYVSSLAQSTDALVAHSVLVLACASFTTQTLLRSAATSTRVRDRIAPFLLTDTGSRPQRSIWSDDRWCLFLSHNFGTGQDATHTVKRNLQMLLPGCRIFLDTCARSAAEARTPSLAAPHRSPAPHPPRARSLSPSP
jgi:hypothetical protein